MGRISYEIDGHFAVDLDGIVDVPVVPVKCVLLQERIGRQGDVGILGEMVAVATVGADRVGSSLLGIRIIHEVKIAHLVPSGAPCQHKRTSATAQLEFGSSTFEKESS